MDSSGIAWNDITSLIYYLKQLHEGDKLYWPSNLWILTTDTISLSLPHPTSTLFWKSFFTSVRLKYGMTFFFLNLQMFHSYLFRWITDTRHKRGLLITHRTVGSQVNPLSLLHTSTVLSQSRWELPTALTHQIRSVISLTWKNTKVCPI